MAPNFLSKLVNHSRERSGSETTRQKSPSPARIRVLSSPDSPVAHSTPNIISNINTSRVPSIATPESRGGADTDGSSSTHPSVTIIPPSPHSDSLAFSETASDRGSDRLHETSRFMEGSANINGISANDSRTMPIYTSNQNGSFADDNTPTPTAKRPEVPSPGKNKKHPPLPSSRPQSRNGNPTPSSSTGDLRQLAQDHSSPTSPPTSTLNLTSPELRRQGSDRSMTRPPAINIDHTRAATSPPQVVSEDGDSQNGIYTTMRPIVESPTAIPAEFVSRSATTSQLPSKPNATLVTPPRDSDVASVSSTGKARKRTWRRGSSPSRKPTGLASAIAASGLAMANPGMSATQQQLIPVQSANGQSRKSSLSRAGSPPYMSPPSGHNRLPSQEFTSPTPSARTKSSRQRSDPPSSPRHRRPSTSVSVSMSDGASEIYEDHGHYSGLEDSSDEDDSESEDDLADLDLGEDDIPVTGFAVASNKRNADFHELFQNIPEGDYLIEDYGCALQREILIQGRLYISENHICFHANIFGWITDLSIPIYEITNLDRKMTAFVIPNAIQITTRQAKYTFASFLSRDTTFDVIYNIWRLARPDDSVSIMSGSQDGRASLEGNRSGLDHIREDGGSEPKKSDIPVKKATLCACGKEGTHFTETALDTIFPGTPDRIHNLIFASGFMKDFMRVDQKLLDIQISDWTPTSEGSKLLGRNMSYIKPLTGSLGPKQTKCEIRDETQYCDFDDYVVTLTTTRTPDVPSGSVFSVKTKTCIMWASAVSTRVLVTTQVEWTGRSFIKGIIEKSCIDGQKLYHGDLERAMRAYIQEHQSEFMPAGVEIPTIQPTEPEASITEKSITGPVEGKQREHERNRRSLQWAWDTFDGAYNVAKQSTSGAIELIRDAWDQSTSTTILIFVIIILILSNLWTLTRVGSSSKELKDRRTTLRRPEEGEQWVHGVVTALWDELTSKQEAQLGYKPPSDRSQPSLRSAAAVPTDHDWRQEVDHLMQTLGTVEERIRLIRDNLARLQDDQGLKAAEKARDAEAFASSSTMGDLD